MPKLGILFFDGPYQKQASESVCKIANAALDKGHSVRIFCYMDAVNAVLEKQKKIEGIMNIEEGFKEILSKGATIRLCNICLLVRGTMKNCITKESGDIKKAGTPDLARIIDETDRLIVIC
ncbi:DsrE/DsrF/TusD sulfur relay family protein [Promethearchaeum syntrophicum]|uniref:DsrE/DsrF/TusD sulfur relay family protein n=1 Tax=Promethearchaeum syntrophicum TaxID=2594042 RepID=A0A5B9DFN2_9ARCH|nr:DsrE family protein [Candidatus Prometheoarchaeum syntrophicum]QEE18119.1 DsrE/DsrF-like family protein [Candidatus Prometheoarchaeum syntrophicum]